MGLGFFRPLEVPLQFKAESVPEIVRKAHCPDCQDEAPGYAMLPLHSFGWDDKGKVVAIIDGYRVGCQKCPCIYSVGPTGTFRQDRGSFPLTPRSQPQIASPENSPEPQPQGLPRAKERPML